MKSTFSVFVVVFVVLCYADWECEPGTPYRENRCSDCTCEETKILKCQDNPCLDRIESILFNCQVGTNSTYKCNSCMCVKDVGTVCTNYPCEENN